MIFTDAERAYLEGQQLGRMATAQPDGTLQASPVGFTYNTELGTIDVRGFGMTGSRKFKNVAANGRAAFVVDDILSLDPYQVRCLEIRGSAEAVHGEANPAVGGDGGIIRIHPKRIISIGINQEFDMNNPKSDNRDVA
jgi:pyridoxamine 5'-phosphate oxidase family protein